MKIVCDSCGAKYSIADEKVQGKVFKIRCKKCSSVIVVAGNDGAEESPNSYDGAYGGTGAAAEWYVVIDGERVGPITRDEVEGYYTTGALHNEAYVWRDGLDDWVMLATLSEFAHLTAETAGPEDRTMITSRALSEADAGWGFGGSTDHIQGSEDEPGDSTVVMDSEEFTVAQSGRGAGGQGFGDAPAAGIQSSFGQYGADNAAIESGSYPQVSEGYDYAAQELAGDYGANVLDAGRMDEGGFSGSGYDERENYDDRDYDDGGGMFAAFDSGASDSGAYESASIDEGPDLGSSRNEELVGARNENSVLFSLSSVEQVKAVSRADKSSGQAQGTDKSGLIDIQALASTHAAMSGGRKEDEDDEFVASTMSMPALMPMGTHKSNKGLIVGVSIGAGLLVVVLVGLVLFLFLRNVDPPPAQPVATVAAASPEQEEEELTAEEKAEEEAAAAAAQAALKAEEEEEAQVEEEKEQEQAEEVAQAPPAARSSGSSSRRNSGSTTARDTGSTARTTGRTARETGSVARDTGSTADSGSTSRTRQLVDRAEPEDSGGGDILDRIGGGGADATRSDLPASLSQSMVTSTFQRHRTQISRCLANNPEGLTDSAPVRFVVDGSGRVTSASAQGGASGTTVGRCLESAGQRMRFPETQEGGSFTFPFRF